MLPSVLWYAQDPVHLHCKVRPGGMWGKRGQPSDADFIEPLLHSFKSKWLTSSWALDSFLGWHLWAKAYPTVWVTSSEVGLKWKVSLWGYKIKLIPWDFLWSSVTWYNSDLSAIMDSYCRVWISKVHPQHPTNHIFPRFEMRILGTVGSSLPTKLCASG
jgi:hypothetical protein